ncbi:MAG: DnaD domain protein [Clostridia bacterium]|nr:DnaD domain protein [Clostridia bacterium]
MALQIQYGNSVVVLPGKAADAVRDAEKSDLAVLLVLLSDASLCNAYGQKGSAEAIAQAAGCSEDEVRSAVAFWRGAGVLSVVGEKKKKVQETAVEEKSASVQTAPAAAAPAADGAALLKKSDELPKYTTAELGNLLEARPETAALLEECQNLFGKLFSTHEVNTVLGLTDYLGLDTEYVLILVTHYCQYCRLQEKRPSVRGLEKLAISLYDRGITDMAALQEELLRQEELQKTQGQLRALFGIGARALTTKEKRMFSDWVHTYKYDMEMIKLAFEIGMDASPDASVAYIDSILKRWNSENIRTAADVEKDRTAREAKRGNGKTAETQSSSFDTDDFFDAAMRRSLGDNYDKIIKGE